MTMPDADRPCLIEVAFPLKQASLDSVHEKNVRHGDISTLHIWPARRPLAACRAALIATLLPDPGTPQARKDLERFYPTIDGKPTVAYLWARTVTCKNCRATIPLLKTRWLCKKENKRVVLTMEPNTNRTGVVFGVRNDVPIVGGNAAQRREYDKKVGSGTMSRSGVACPCCDVPSLTMEDIRLEGRAGRLCSVMTAVVVDGPDGKEYRTPTPEEIKAASRAEGELDRAYADVPFGLPDEPTPAGGGRGAGRAFSVQSFGMMRWRDLFTPRQLLALGTFVKWTRASPTTMAAEGYPGEWMEAIAAYLAITIDRIADYNSQQCVPDPTPTPKRHPAYIFQVRVGCDVGLHRRRGRRNLCWLISRRG